MIEIEIEAIWRFRRREDAQSLQIMLDVLAEIRASGKITAAAEKVHVSYRHAWNMIEKWSEFFDTPLVIRRQGAGTRLTPFGERLVWAGERLEARLRPLLQNLSQELETEINQMLPHGPLVLRVHASHGFAVPKLRELLSREQDISVDLRYVSNQNSLVSLAHDGCDLAGMHLPQGELRKRAIAASRGWLNPNVHRVISLVTREMGLMVQRGNPLGILELKRLLDPAVRFVNRDSDSGTRLLFEQLLTQHGISGAAINGYEHTEFTHMPPSQHMSRAGWPMSHSASNRRHASSGSTSCGSSPRIISSSAEAIFSKLPPSSVFYRLCAARNSTVLSRSSRAIM